MEFLPKNVQKILVAPSEVCIVSRPNDCRKKKRAMKSSYERDFATIRPPRLCEGQYPRMFVSFAPVDPSLQRQR